MEGLITNCQVPLFDEIPTYRKCNQFYNASNYTCKFNDNILKILKHKYFSRTWIGQDPSSKQNIKNRNTFFYHIISKRFTE